MTIGFEWAHAGHSPAELVTPAELEEHADDGNDAGDWGLAAMTGSNGFMLYGSLNDLHAWLTRALESIEEPRRREMNRRIKQQRREQGLPKCRHKFDLMEDGYGRTWRKTEVDEENRTILATTDGWGDFTDEGIGGEYLQCRMCGHRKLIPKDWDLDFV